MKKNYRRRRAPAVRRAVRSRQGPSKSIRPINVATITETREAQAIAVNTCYNEQFNIAEFPRALETAKSFKFYRATRVEYIYTPEYNVFSESSGSTKPYLRYIMNRTGDQTTLNAGDLENMGAKPLSFSSSKVIAYKPNLAQTIGVFSTSGNTQDQLGLEPKYDAWLATKFLVNQLAPAAGVSPSATAMYNCPYYLGHYVIISADAIEKPQVGTLEIHVQWEFKDPQVSTTRTTVSNGADAAAAAAV